MYKWYGNAVECYVYLADVNDNIGGVEFEKSRWFTRGWTLQELVAPPTILFFNSEWKEIGTKLSLCQSIHSVTSIPSKVLLKQTLVGYSIAQKMSWASTRETTRTEDIAYCLLGIFGISMPLIYGEGKKSFKRLQLEIIKASNDQSIFAWTEPISLKFKKMGVSELLAESPREFWTGGNITQFPEWKYFALFPNAQNNFSYPYSMTNVGLEIYLPVAPHAVNTEWSTPQKVGFLNCARLSGDGKISTIGIILAKRLNSEIYDRILYKQLFEESYETALGDNSRARSHPPERLLIFGSQTDLLSDNRFMMPHESYESSSIVIQHFGLDLVADSILKGPCYSSPNAFARILLFSVPRSGKRFLVMLGKWNLETRPWSWIFRSITDDLSVTQAFEIANSVSRAPTITRNGLDHDRVAIKLDSRSQVDLAWRKILHEGTPRYMATISLSPSQIKELHESYQSISWCIT